MTNIILKSANADNSGVIDRVQLKEAMIANTDKMNAITEETTPPQTNAIVSQVMQALAESSNGLIQKREFKEALLKVADQN